MNWFASLAKRKSASVARERLQILLTHERVRSGQPDFCRSCARKSLPWSQSTSQWSRIRSK